MKKTSTQKRVATCRKWLLVVFVSLASGAAALSGSPAAQLLNTTGATVTLAVKDEPLNNVLQSIIKQSGCEIVYVNAMTNAVRCRNIDVKGVSVNEALTAVLGGTGLTYAVQNGRYVISPRPTARTPEDGRRVTGVVVDPNGEPLAGVSVVVKGTTQGVKTDARGHFAIIIRNAPARPVLAFSYIGMELQEADVVDNNELRIKLKDSPTAIGEVIVNTGYQNIDRRLTTGSYDVVKAEDLAMAGIANIDQMLEGRVAGMLVSMPSAKVGSTAKISIRGQSTLLGNTDPLWVVDGITMPDPPKMKDLQSQLMVYGNDLRELVANQISWLNPMDIETVTVLKDASATSIYGAKASNGVIVITTKRGKGDGRTSVNFSTTMTVNTRPTYANLSGMTSEEWIDYYSYYANNGATLKDPAIRQLNTFSGLRALYDADDDRVKTEDYRRIVARFSNSNTDWLDLLCRTGISQQHNLSLSGGKEGLDFNISGSYLKEQGQEIGNDNERYTVATGVGFKLGEKVRIRTNLYASFSNKTGFATGIDPLEYAIITNRALPAYEENGDLLYYRKKASYRHNANTLMGGLNFNIINELAHGGSMVKDMQLVGNVDLIWEIIPGLQYNFKAGITRQSAFSELYADEQTFRIANSYRGYDFEDPAVVMGNDTWNAAILNYGGIFRTADAYQTSYNVQNQLSYEKRFNENHRLNVFVGSEIKSQNNIAHENLMFGYMPDRGMGVVKPNEMFKSIGTGGLSNFLGVFEELYGGGGTDAIEAGGWSAYQPVVNHVSFLSNVAYSLKNRYVFTGSIRTEASNTFGQDVNKRFDPTYSVGAAWNADQEPFIRSISKWVQQLKFRVSYGVNGLDPASQSPYPIFKRGKINTEGWKTSTLHELPNPFLRWERTEMVNLGVDFYILGFLSGVVEYYDRTSQIAQKMLIELESGKEDMVINGGMISNRGVELTFNFTPIKTEDLGLNVRVNAGKNFNKGRNTSDLTMETADYLSGSTNRIIKGFPVGALWAWDFKGLNPETGLPEFNWDVPDDQRGPACDPKTFLVYVGSVIPDITAGLNLSFRYKSFTLSSNFSAQLGGKTRLPNPYDFISFNNGCLPFDDMNLPRELLRAWKNPGDKTDIPAVYTGKLGTDYRILVPTDPINGGTAATNIYDMWAKSDARIIDNSFIRCTSLSLSWNLKPEWTNKIGLKMVNLNFSMNNVFVIANKKLNGFDPMYAAHGIQRTAPKAFSFGVNLSF